MAQNFTTTPSTLHNLEEVIGVANLAQLKKSGSGRIGIAIYNNTPAEILFIGTAWIDADTNAFPLPNDRTFTFDETELKDVSVMDNGVAIDIRWAGVRANQSL